MTGIIKILWKSKPSYI